MDTKRTVRLDFTTYYNYNIEVDEPELFEAEINDMIFTIDIRDMEVFELENAEDLPILKDVLDSV